MKTDAITIYKIEKHYTTKFRIPDKKKVYYSVNISNSGEHHQIKGEKHFNESIIEDMTLREVKKAIIEDLKE